MQQEDLRSFDLECLSTIRRKRNQKGKVDNYWMYWNELEYIMTRQMLGTNEWKMLKNDYVVAEVWHQRVGECMYKHSIHTYEWLYISSKGLTIKEHGHDKIVNNGKQVKKSSQIYVFFNDGHMEACGRDQMHSLYVSEPTYVLVINVTGKGK